MRGPAISDIPRRGSVGPVGGHRAMVQG